MTLWELSVVGAYLAGVGPSGLDDCKLPDWLVRGRGWERILCELRHTQKYGRKRTLHPYLDEVVSRFEILVTIDSPEVRRRFSDWPWGADASTAAWMEEESKKEGNMKFRAVDTSVVTVAVRQKRRKKGGKRK